MWWWVWGIVLGWDTCDVGGDRGVVVGMGDRGVVLGVVVPAM